MWVVSVEMCYTYHGGRLLHLGLKLTELASCNASILAVHASTNCPLLGHIWMSLFLSFISGFFVPDTEGSHNTLTKPLALETSPKHDPHQSLVILIQLFPLYREEPEAPRN